MTQRQQEDGEILSLSVLQRIGDFSEEEMGCSSKHPFSNDLFWMNAVRQWDKEILESISEISHDTFLITHVKHYGKILKDESAFPDRIIRFL